MMDGEIETLNAKEVKTKPKKRGWLFWILFWLISVVLLFGWYIFLQVRNKNIQNLKPLVGVLPVGSERQNELRVMLDIFDKSAGFDEEKTFLILLQNDMELRPGGGFIGAFGVLKMNDGKVADIQIHDTGNFDGRIPNAEKPPYPMGEMLYIKSWKLRDSNWSPDFKINAEKAEYFYKLGEGEENFDGVMAINTVVLNSFLEITGPIRIDEYPGEYSDENAIAQLEYQVEKGYAEQGIKKGERKDIIKKLAKVLVEKTHSFNNSQRLELVKKIEKHLQEKDITLYFKDEDLQKEIEEMGWGGRVKDYSGDYLMVVDANLNSLKSDHCIRRSIDYQVDLSGDAPQAVLNLTYKHTCRVEDWMTSDYQDWLRVYVPKSSWLVESSGQEGKVRFEEDLGKKVLAMKVYVPIGQTKTVTLKYSLPAEIKNGVYNLLIQKQSGAGEVPVKILVKEADGTTEEAEEMLAGDKVFNF